MVSAEQTVSQRVAVTTAGNPVLDGPIAMEPTAQSELDAANALLFKVLGRVLRLKTIAADDTYLSLCHDLRRTIIVIREIKRATGLELPLTLFMEAKTVREIAQCIATRTWPPSNGLVLLKPAELGTTLPPLFTFPGLGGALIELVDVISEVGYAGAVYGLPYRGLDGYTAPADTVNPLAEDSVKKIRALQPDGPYYLLAYSAGAYVALETARLLDGDRGKVAFLGMIEPGVHERFWPAAVWIRFLFSLIKMRRSQAIDAAQKKQASEETDRKQEKSGSALQHLCSAVVKKAAYILQRSQRLLVRFHHRYGNPRQPGFATNSPYYVGNLPTLIQAVRDASIVCLATYDFRRYTGNVIYFRSERGDQLMCKPDVIWPRYLPKLRFVVVPGDHASMMTPPHAQALASVVSSYLPRSGR